VKTPPENTHQSLPTRGRPYLADAIAAAYACAFYAWLMVRTPGTPSASLVGELAFLPLGLALAWASWRNARVPSLDSRTRLAWRLLVGAYLSLWVSGSMWSFLLWHNNTSQALWVDRLEVVQHILALAAYLAFPDRRLGRDAGVRFVADLALTIVAGFVLAFDFVLRVSGVEPGAPTYTTVIVSASIEWVIFVVVTVGAARKRDAEARTALGLLLAANMAYLFANYFYARDMSGYRSGDAVDGLWFGAWVLRWTAVRTAWHLYRRRADRPATAMSQAAAEYRSSALSYVILAGAFILLIGEIVAGERRSIELMAVAAAVMASLLLFRQFAELRVSRRLFDAQLAQEARFRSLVQHSSDVVLVVDTAGRTTYVSPSATRIFGESAGITTGANIRDLVPEDDAATLASIFHRTGSEPRSLNTRMQTAAGDWRDLEMLWSDLRDDRAVGGIVLNCRDVTERNELERKLQHAQKIDAVGHLAGGLAHDFNNLLMVIRGYTELLRSDLPPDASSQADLANMEQAVDRASTVTRKLLAFSRRQAVQPTVLDLNAVLCDLRPIFRQLVTDKVDVQLDTDGELWHVKADQGQVEQVVVNLATNARDAMPHGGALRILTRNRHVEADRSVVGGPPPGDYVALEVIDSGTGMDEMVRTHIFEPFFSTKPKDRGVGLGLAMVHGIVTRAGGQITVDSLPGRGTTFTILLPRTTEAGNHGSKDETPAAPSAGARTVLLVDDEPAVRTITRRLLERAGYKVVEAADGYEALAIAARPEVKLDLLLTDMVMPGLTGQQVVIGFRASRPGVPVVGITGYAGDSDRVTAGEAGLAGLVTKPFSADALVRAIASACHNQ
jgi:PAS domain S-box-containing protein